MKVAPLIAVALILCIAFPCQVQAKKKPKPKFCVGKDGNQYAVGEGYDDNDGKACVHYKCVRKKKKFVMKKGECVEDGEWSSWSSWSACSSTCGSATKTRTRTCSSPAPSNGGNPCSGQEEQIEQCSNPSCGPDVNMKVDSLELNFQSMNGSMQALQTTMLSVLELMTTMQSTADKQGTCMSDLSSSDCPDSAPGKVGVVAHINTIKAGISTNKAGISTNKAGVTSAQADINTNKEGINTNKADVNTNKAGINTNKAGINTNKAGINTNKGGINTNKADVNTNKAGINTNNVVINTNKAGIFTNKVDINTNKVGINTNKAGINTNKVDINTNKADINTNKAGIMENKAAISPHHGGCVHGRKTSYMMIDGRSVEVSCEDSKDGKSAWTVIQRRGQYGNPEDHFSREWTEYENGFGSPQDEVWLGLRNMAAMTKEGEWQLKVDLKDWTDVKYEALYNKFSVGPGQRYELHISDFDPSKSSLAEKNLNYHNGKPFSTTDKDRDGHVRNCALNEGGGGWWWDNCGWSLNGLNFNTQQSATDGICWYYGGPRGDGWTTWKGSVMKIRRVNP